MILSQILIFFVSIIFISLSVSGFGRIIDLNIKKNFFLDIFLGFIIISFIITFVHFFLKIDLLISFLIFIFGILVFFFKKNISLINSFQIRSIFFFSNNFIFYSYFYIPKISRGFWLLSSPIRS